MAGSDQEQAAAERYITGDETLAQIAAGMEIPLSTLKKWCKAGAWADKRKKAKARALRQAVTIATGKKARELAKLIEASGEMEQALLLAARTVAREMAKMEPDENGELNTSAVVETKQLMDGSRAMTLESLAKSIEKLASARTMLGYGMTAADTEKIRILQRKQRLEEQKAKAEAKKAELISGGGVEIKMDKAVEELSE